MQQQPTHLQRHCAPPTTGLHCHKPLQLLLEVRPPLQPVAGAVPQYQQMLALQWEPQPSTAQPNLHMPANSNKQRGVQQVRVQLLGSWLQANGLHMTPNCITGSLTHVQRSSFCSAD